MFDECVTMEGYEKHSFRIKKDSEYQKYLKDELDDYTKWVAVNHNEYTGDVEQIAEYINGAVASYYKSDFISATQAIQKIVDENNFLLCETKMGGDGSDDVLFKARVAEPTENIKHEDMLHIPFDCRNIVASQRFSLSGTPCIYLSRSSDTCW